MQQIFGDDAAVNLTARFALIMLMAAFNGFNVRTDSRRLLRGISKNPMFVFIASCIIIGTIAIVDFGGELFQVVPLSHDQWIAVFALAFLVIPMDLIRKTLAK